MLRSLDSDYLEQNSMCPLLASSGSVPDIGCVELVVGVGQSTCMGRLVSRRIVKEPISLFDRTTSPRPDLFFARAAARSDRQGWAEGPSRSDLPLTVTSTAADLLDRGRSFFALQCWATENTEGSSPSCAQLARHKLVFGRPVRIANHDAVMRIGGEAPRRWAHSNSRCEDHVLYRVAATSVRQLQLGIDVTPRLQPQLSYSCRRAQEQSDRRLAGRHEAPQRHEELARERHDHRLARAAAGIRSALPIPRTERAVLLMDQMTPGELDHPAAHAGVARFGKSSLASFLAALVGGTGQASIARESLTVLGCCARTPPARACPRSQCRPRPPARAGVPSHGVALQALPPSVWPGSSRSP
jgi:hypothetical protein